MSFLFALEEMTAEISSNKKPEDDDKDEAVTQEDINIGMLDGAFLSSEVLKYDTMWNLAVEHYADPSLFSREDASPGNDQQEKSKKANFFLKMWKAFIEGVTKFFKWVWDHLVKFWKFITSGFKKKNKGDSGIKSKPEDIQKAKEEMQQDTQQAQEHKVSEAVVESADNGNVEDIIEAVEPIQENATILAEAEKEFTVVDEVFEKAEKESGGDNNDNGGGGSSSEPEHNVNLNGDRSGIDHFAKKIYQNHKVGNKISGGGDVKPDVILLGPPQKLLETFQKMEKETPQEQKVEEVVKKIKNSNRGPDGRFIKKAQEVVNSIDPKNAQSAVNANARLEKMKAEAIAIAEKLESIIKKMESITVAVTNTATRVGKAVESRIVKFFKSVVNAVVNFFQRIVNAFKKAMSKVQKAMMNAIQILRGYGDMFIYRVRLLDTMMRRLATNVGEAVSNSYNQAKSQVAGNYL